MLTHQQAERLLHRYFLAETTLAEEEQLRDYFRAGDVAPELVELDPMFGFWEAARGEHKVAARMRRLSRRRLAKQLISAVAAAAVLVLMLTTWMHYQAPAPVTIAASTPIDWSKHEVTDPEEAYLVLRKALKTSSSQLNRSTRLTIRGIKQAEGLLR